MSKIEYYNRPLVAFDPSNIEHRNYFHQFLLTQAWGRCPVRFICPDERGPEGLVGIITRQLVDYYARKEFGNSPKIKGMSSQVNKITKNLSIKNKRKENDNITDDQRESGIPIDA